MYLNITFWPLGYLALATPLDANVHVNTFSKLGHSTNLSNPNVFAVVPTCQDFLVSATKVPFDNNTTFAPTPLGGEGADVPEIRSADPGIFVLSWK